ncbi:hypothetical protein D9611_014562 [Ephemerocybe angulata]|uniref:Uncharacterized protein n=1 Tax=Ephemerocybe angulata TaxID=980116 RepID=A0A8H5FI82_9AGAR|nr:hypothetical protein D9611_014562 [Tulosesus angulatus]
MGKLRLHAPARRRPYHDHLQPHKDFNLPPPVVPSPAPHHYPMPPSRSVGSTQHPPSRRRVVTLVAAPHLIPPPPFDLPAAFNLRAALREHPIFPSLPFNAAARRCALLDAGECVDMRTARRCHPLLAARCGGKETRAPRCGRVRGCAHTLVSSPPCRSMRRLGDVLSSMRESAWM